MPIRKKTAKGKTRVIKRDRPIFMDQKICSNDAVELDPPCFLPLDYTQQMGTVMKRISSWQELMWLASWYNRGLTLDVAHSVDPALLCEMINNFLPDTTWIKKQSKYLNNLTGAVRSLLLDFTRHGDEVLNAWIRGHHEQAVARYRHFTYDETLFSHLLFASIFYFNFDVTWFTDLGQEMYGTSRKQIKTHLKANVIITSDMLTDFGVMALIDIAAQTLQATIENAPPFQKQVVLFRGGQSRRVESSGFLSTTSDVRVALDFAGSGQLTQIVVAAGVPTLMIDRSHSSDESEILLSPSFKLQADTCKKEEVVRIYPKRDREGRMTHTCQKTRLFLCRVLIN